MPQLPGFQEQTRLSPSSPVAIAGTGDARIQGEQLASIGKSVMHATSLLAESQAESAKNQATTLSFAAQERAMKESVDGKDIPELTKKYTEESFNELRKNTDPLVNFKMNGVYEQLTAQSEVQAMRNSSTKIRATTLQTEKNNIDEISKKAAQFPDLAPQLVQDYRNRAASLANDPMGIDHESASQLFDLAQEKIAEGRIDGMLAKPEMHGQLAREMGFAEDALNINVKPGEYGLNGDGEIKVPYVDKNGNKMDPRVSDVYRGLKPEYKDQVMRKLQAENERSQRVKLSTVNSYTNAFISEALAGKEIRPQDANKVRAMIAGAPEEVRAQYMEQVKEAERISPVMQAFRSGTDGQGFKMLADLDKQLAGETKSNDQTVRVKAEQLQLKARTAIQSIIDDRNKDPGAATVGTNQKVAQLHAASKSGDTKDFADYATQTLEVQRMQGVASPRLLTNGEALDMGSKLVAANTADPRAMDEAMIGMEKQYGEHFPQIISEIAEKNPKLDKSLIIASQMSDRSSRLAVFSNMGAGGKAADDRFKEKITTAERETWKQELNAQVDKFQASIAPSGTLTGVLSTTSAFSTQIETEAKKLYAGGMGISEAMRAANDTIVHRNFEFIDTSTTKIIVPRTVNSIPAVKQFFTANDPRAYVSGSERNTSTGSANVLSRFGISEPPQWMKDKNPGVSNSDLKSNYLSLISGKGAWVTNRDQTGANLVIKYGDTNLAVEDSGGKPVQIKFNDMSKYLGVGK